MLRTRVQDDGYLTVSGVSPPWRRVQIIPTAEGTAPAACGLINAMPVPSPARFARIGLIGRPGSPELAEPLSRLTAFLAARGHAVVHEEDTARLASLPGIPAVAAERLGAAIDLAIVVGGDGTMLS